MADESRPMVNDPAEHLFRMFAANLDGAVTLTMCQAFVRLLAAALGPGAKADAAPVHIDRTQEWWLAKARAEGDSDVGAGLPFDEEDARLADCAPAATPEATGAPSRVTIYREPRGYWTSSPLSFADVIATCDYIRADVAEREAAELRRQVDRAVESVAAWEGANIVLRRERDAALARVAEVEAEREAFARRVVEATIRYLLPNRTAIIREMGHVDRIVASVCASPIPAAAAEAPQEPTIAAATAISAGVSMGGTKMGGGR